MRPHGAKIPCVKCRNRRRVPSSQATACRPAPGPPVVKIEYAGIFAREYAVSYIHPAIPVNTGIVTFDFKIERFCDRNCCHNRVFTKTTTAAWPRYLCKAKRKRRDCCRGAFIIPTRWRAGPWVRVLWGLQLCAVSTTPSTTSRVPMTRVRLMVSPSSRTPSASVTRKPRPTKG